MATFVLIHGAWHDGSTRQLVSDRLRLSGHTVHTPTIAGHGKGVDKNVTHNDCVQSIVDYFIDGDIRDAIVVGHSFGGTGERPSSAKRERCRSTNLVTSRKATVTNQCRDGGWLSVKAVCYRASSFSPGCLRRARHRAGARTFSCREAVA